MCVWLPLKSFDQQITSRVARLGPNILKKSTPVPNNQKKTVHLIRDSTITKCPVLFQERIHKMIDVRMTVLDNEIISAGLRARDTDGKQRLDIRRNNMRDVAYEIIEVSDDISARVHAMLKSYNLRFATLDFAITADNSWFFFEINPNGQWAWLDLEAGTNIGGLFVDVFRKQMSLWR